MKAKILRLLPIEFTALAFTAVCVLTMVIFGMKVYHPDGWSFTSIINPHVVIVMVFALGGLIVSSVIHTGWNDLSGALHIVRTLFALFIIVFWFGNFKLWAHLINPYNFDAVYWAIDQPFRPVESVLAWIHSPIVKVLSLLTSNPYHGLYLIMFLVIYAAYAFRSDERGFDQVLFALAITLVAGGIGYAIAPAFGPFVYGVGTSPVATEIQATMLAFTKDMIQSRGFTFNGGQYYDILGAMPSLHAAHGLVLTIYAYRFHRWAGHLFLLLLGYMMAEAVLSNWHYWIDLPVGFAISLIAVYAADRWVRKRPSDGGNQAGAIVVSEAIPGSDSIKPESVVMAANG